jgi:TRAP-type transport system small permease protein
MSVAGRETRDRAASSTLLRVLGGIAAVSLFSMMALTFVSVIARYFLNKPIAGVEEVQGFLLGFVIFSALPLVTLRQRHIAVHAFAAMLRGRAAQAQHVFVLAVTALGFAFIGYLLFVQGEMLREENLHSNYLNIPEAPFPYVFTLLTWAAALAALLLLVRRAPAAAPDTIADEASRDA